MSIIKGTASIDSNTKIINTVTIEDSAVLVGSVKAGMELGYGSANNQRLNFQPCVVSSRRNARMIYFLEDTIQDQIAIPEMCKNCSMYSSTLVSK